MDPERLAERFEADRARLQAMAFRLLGSASEADDAVQEAWLRLSRADASAVRNLGGWLTTVVARVCLDLLRSRRSRREEPLALHGDSALEAAGPEGEAVLSESIGLAMRAVLDRLAPAERVALVLHDVFAVSFDEIAGIIDRTPAAARQLASRGRRRVRGGAEDGRAVDVARHQEIVAAFFRASRDGDFQALLAVLDPNVTLRIDAAALRMSARSGWLTAPELRGAQAVAKQFDGAAQAARLASIDGAPGAVWAPKGTPLLVFGFTVRNGKVVEIELVADNARLGRLQIEVPT